MRRVFGALLAAGALFLSGEAMAKEVTTSISVSGWHCGGCTAATEASLKKVEGVTAAKANLEAGKVEVTFDDAKAKVADLEKAVEKAGYKVVHP